jgi:N-acetylglucosaminyl-diphospho-decaprenol L-rhamnosyltransferase
MTLSVPSLGLVTIWYRAGREMERYLANLHELRYPRVQPVFVIHAQTPAEVARLRAGAPQALILEPGANLGTAAGWNLGIQRLLALGVDYIGIWNVDVTLSEACPDRLVEALEADSAIAAAGPLLFYSDDPGRVQMYGGSVDPASGLSHHDYCGTQDLAGLPPLRQAGYLDGGTMLMRSGALGQVGGFDESLFMYYEDSLLCQRFQRAGYRTVAVRAARAWHHHRAEHGQMLRPHEVFYLARNRFYFVRTLAGPAATRRLAARSLCALPRSVLFYLRRRQVVLARALVSGTCCGLAGQMSGRWPDATARRLTRPATLPAGRAG